MCLCVFVCVCVCTFRCVRLCTLMYACLCAGICVLETTATFLDNSNLQIISLLLIFSRFDYYNSSYYGLLETTLHLLTKAFNSAARLFSGTLKFSRKSCSYLFTLVAF